MLRLDIRNSEGGLGMQAPCVLGNCRFTALHQSNAGHLEHLPAWLFRSWLLRGQTQGRTVTIDCSEQRHFQKAMTATKQHSFLSYNLSQVYTCGFGTLRVVCAQHVCRRLIQIQQYCCHEPERAKLGVTHSALKLVDICYLKHVISQQMRGHGSCYTLPYSSTGDVTGGHSSLADTGKSDGWMF
jgi:hypothetical protein